MIGKCYETFGLVKYMLVIIPAPSLCMSFDIRATHSEESLRQRQACFVSHGLCKVWVNHLSNFSRGGGGGDTASCSVYWLPITEDSSVDTGYFGEMEQVFYH